ncbi:molybdopterin oxidoreductase-like protein, membrane subunit [Dehalococcoides mccartyi BTF08]|uniref:NrfD/PsrC family molybdoenzyme membrane anchor subunit n=1 Tax=Dehalococcoides mccartyi TaxID=61435 RepID=UPI0002B75E21|nr:NrfD/PsrC family molybdoenzyme membrane anchor subunit [Dehalococcoides mccartyi]AGG07174.1 molybdopterin oxidoreductase-like protein, membrane subunit [Dehalococcoides mccartyi BTF08]
MNWKRIALGILILSLAAGVWGFLMLLNNGQQMLGLGSFVVWGLWMALYVFFASTAAGMFFIASLDLLFKVKTFAGTGKIFMLASLASLGAGLIHILINEGRPERVMNVFLHPNFDSVLAWSVWIYTLIALATTAILLVLFIPQKRLPFRKEPVIKWLMILSFPVAVIASGAVGFTLSTQSSHSFWSVGLFPVLFPIFGMSAGFALSRIIVALYGDKTSPGYPRLAKTMAISTIALLLSITYIIGSVLFVGIYDATPPTIEAANYIMFGQYWYGFWIVQIGLGIVVALGALIKVLSKPGLSKKPAWGLTIGVLVLLGAAVARLNFIIPAQIVAGADFLSSPIIDSRYIDSYIPTLPEWALSAGITAAVILAFYIVAKMMKLIPVRIGNEETGDE